MRLFSSKTLALLALSAGIGCGVAACMQGAARQPVAAVPTASVPGFGLYYMDEGSSAKLAYGQPNSDNVGLMLQCTKGSHVVEVTDAAPAGGAPVITLASAGQVQSLKVKTEDGDGATLLVARTAYDAAPLSAFRRSGRLDVTHGSTRYGVAATSDERVGVERFFAVCRG